MLWLYGEIYKSKDRIQSLTRLRPENYIEGTQNKNLSLGTKMYTPTITLIPLEWGNRNSYFISRSQTEKYIHRIEHLLLMIIQLLICIT